jgi:membrane-associated protein
MGLRHNEAMDAGALLESFGYLIIFVSIFIECGLLLGLILPLPSFSLLFAAGVFANTDKLNLGLVILIASVSAIAGYVVGYFTGYKYGRRLLYEKKTEKYFTEQQGKSAERFMKKHGYSTLILSRWLPVMHNVAPMLGGVSKTPIMPFMLTNVIGGVLWVASTTYAGYFIGKIVPHAQYYILPFIGILIIVMNSPLGKRVATYVIKKVEQY